MDFKNIEMKDEKDIPESVTHGKYDYRPLVLSAKRLHPGKALQIPIAKDHHIQSIRSALSRYEKGRKYRVQMRKIDSKKYAIVKLADGHK